MEYRQRFRLLYRENGAAAMAAGRCRLPPCEYAGKKGNAFPRHSILNRQVQNAPGRARETTAAEPLWFISAPYFIG
jgi:hypothetical protein